MFGWFGNLPMFRLDRDCYGGIHISIFIKLDLRNRIRLGKNYSKIRWAHEQYFLTRERNLRDIIQAEAAIGIRSQYGPDPDGWDEFVSYWKKNGRTPSYEMWLMLCGTNPLDLMIPGSDEEWRKKMTELIELEKENGYSEQSIDWPPQRVPSD